MSNEETKINSMEENYKDLQALIECLNIDFDKFREKRVKAAGQRARNNLLNTKKLCDKLRKQILEEIRTIPVKHRISSDDKPSEEQEEVKEEEEEKKDDDKPSEREVMEELGEIPKVITKTEVKDEVKEQEEKPKKKRRKANKKKE